MNNLTIHIMFFLLSCSYAQNIYVAQQQDFCNEIHRDSSITLTDQLLPVKHLMAEKTGVYSLEEGDMAMVARAWLSEYAEKPSIFSTLFFPWIMSV